MAVIGTALADGQLPAAEGVLYTVPAGTITYIKSIICANTGAGQNVVLLYLRVDGVNSRRLIRVPLETNEQLYFYPPLTLEAADEIRGEATNATEVDYVISGGEDA